MTTDIVQHITEIGRRARSASQVVANVSAQRKNEALLAMALELEASASGILSANRLDLESGSRAGSAPAMLDRLRIDEMRLASMARGVRELAVLADPVGETLREWDRPSGLRIAKVRIPIGVIGIIYESRPNVTSDAAALCLKAGNAVILRGGSEALRTNEAIARALRSGCAKAELPEDTIQFISLPDRAAVRAMAEMSAFIDVIIPRGGKSLIETVAGLARMPVIKHFDGVCHVFVDRDARLAMAESIVLNAKCQRPGVCNAVETVLVHADLAEAFLRRCGRSLLDHGVELRGDSQTRSILGDVVKPAREEDWRTEYLDLILSVRVVQNLEEAINHINDYGSHHTDAIVTEDAKAAETFLRRVDSAVVLWNASTRFSDGGEFGFGAEIGISTERLHARGPMGLEELTTYKYRVTGSGQVRG
jgi:glutamate-5-semialdehyde dehydrogenase